MRIMTILIGCLLVCCFACQEKTNRLLDHGKLRVMNRFFDYSHTLDPEKDAIRIENKAPWMTFSLQGYEGTAPITFTIESVTSTAGEEQAALFKEELTIRGGGAMFYPLEHKAGAGTYVVSVRLTNEGYSQVIENAYTFLIEE